MAIKETDIQRAICDYLAAKRHFFWRSNNVPVFDSVRDRYRALPKHTMRGIPDIIVIRDGHAIFLEVKAEGGRLSAHQQLFREAAFAAGALYAVVRSIDDVQAIGL